jgi:hypothetical protein
MDPAAQESIEKLALRNPPRPLSRSDITGGEECKTVKDLS